MKINEDMRESVEKIWNVHEQAIRLMQWRKLAPPISIYVLGYMMNKWEMASFQGRETTEKRLFAMLADLRRTDRVRAAKRLHIGQRRRKHPMQRRVRIRRLIAHDRAFVLQAIETLAGSARLIWFLMLRGDLSQDESLTLIALLILDYQYALNLPAAALRDDLIAVWDVCSERTQQEISKN